MNKNTADLYMQLNEANTKIKELRREIEDIKLQMLQLKRLQEEVGQLTNAVELLWRR